MGKVNLTQEQQDWVNQKLSGFDVIYVGIHGSHLYGLDREGSDIDLKAVYLPSKRNLIRGEAIKTYNHKNDELDIEIEIKSLPSFLKSASSCDTNCIDLLHAPKSMCLYSDRLWDELKKERKSMYAKNMRGIVGYIKTHSKKYTNKIDRLNEMKVLLDSVKDYHDSNTIRACVGMLPINSYKYIKVVQSDKLKDGHQEYLEVCGKKYCLSWDVSKLKTAMEVEIKRYGERSNKGADKGIDSKSLSHALRVLLQLKEIITTRDLKFPLKGAEYVKAVKLGEVTDVIEVLDKIDTLYDECMELLEESNLPEEVDITNMYKVIEDYYFGELLR